MACCGVQTQDAYCCIQLLNGSEIDMNLELKMRGSDLLDHVFTHLNLVETDYFGLRFIDADNQTHWLNPEKPVTKQLKAVNPMTLYFGVKFYVEDPTRLAEEVTRYQFFLQLKMDMLQGRLPCSFSLAAELFAYAVQSELGDYDADLHPPSYCSEFRFVPNQTEELEKATSEQHQKLVGMLPAKAELGFLERGKRLEMYGVDLTPVTGQDRTEYFLGTTPSGVVVYRNKIKIVSYSWSKITQMNFRHTEFKLIVGDKECVWLLPSRSSCKHLFQCYVEQHMFFRLRPSMLERNGTLTKSIKSNGSRYSFRTQEEALQNSMRLRRPEPHVQRVASRRYLRRVSTNEGDDSMYIDHSSIMASPNPVLENGMVTPGRVPKTMAPEPVRRSQSQMSGRGSPTSGISIRSVPWEETDGALAERGMYTQRGESPVSTRSAHKTRRPNSRAPSPGTTRHRRHHGDKSGSETESIGSRKYRYRRSLTGSEASGDEATHRRRRRRRRSRSRESSGSEGDHRHRSRRSRSRDHMVESEAQWNAVQTGDGVQRGAVREPGEAVVKTLKNGVGSPEESDEYKWYKGRRQLADIKASTELRKHIQLGLQEPPSSLEVENPLDIPYTNIVTDAGVAVRVSHSPTRQRSRPNSGAYRRSRGEFHDDAESVHSGKESVHSMRSTATRRTDPGSYNARSGNTTTTMPLDLIQSGQGGQQRSPARVNYESDGQRGRRRNRGQQDEMSEAESVRGGGGSIPSYLLAQRGQGMFSQKPGANQPDNHTTSAINNNQVVNRRSEMANGRTETTSVDQPSSRNPTESRQNPPPAYVPAPVYVSSNHAPSVARSNQDRVAFEAPSVRQGVHHTREDSGFEQEEAYHSTSEDSSVATLDIIQE